MKKILTMEEIGRLAELAADFVRRTEDRRVLLSIDRNYSGETVMSLAVFQSKTWRTLASDEYLLEPETTTAAEALYGILSGIRKPSEAEEESHE